MTIAIEDFAYELPEELIAHVPSEPRDQARLMVVDVDQEQITHHHFFDLAEFLGANDVLVLNQSKVFPARLLGHKITGGKVEVMLIQALGDQIWRVISSPRLKLDQPLFFDGGLEAVVVKEEVDRGEAQIKFNLRGPELLNKIDEVGLTPTPPYIKRLLSESQLREKYQTVYAKDVGSAAAPTAGMHFTPELLAKLKTKGVQIETVTLHVGLGTFLPVRAENLTSGKLHSEAYEVTAEVAARLNDSKKAGKRIIAVGTTTLRTLESAANLSDDGLLTPQKSDTEIFIFPPYQFKFVDSLITNFHLPKSSLLMLVSALVSYPNRSKHFTNFADSIIGEAYRVAVAEKYHFFSFGDAMWLK